MNLLFLDVETTGLDHNRHEICSMAFSPLDGPMTYFRVSCNYPLRADDKALEINGFSREGLRDGYLSRSVREALERYHGYTLAGWNIGFDIRFLMNLQQRVFSSGTLPFHYRPLDVASLAWPLLLGGKVKSLGLNSVCDYFGVSNEGAHDAAADVRRTIEVYRHLIGMI